MSVITGYVTKQANNTILVVVISLLALLTLFALFEELDESNAAYGFQQAVEYIIYTTPRRLDEILIYGLFMGYLIALGRLAETNELTIFRASGMTPTKICGALLPSMVIWLGFSVVLAEFVAPSSEREAEANKLSIMYGDNAIGRRGGLWLHTGNMFMHVNAIDQRNQLQGITQYWLDEENNLYETIRADIGNYDANDELWLLEQGSRTLLQDGKSVTERFAHWAWENPITPQVIAAQAFLEPSKMSMQALYRQIEFNRAQQRGVNEYELAFWNRVLKPVSFFGLTLFALGVVLGPLREVSMGLRLTFGIFAGLGFKYLQDLFAPAAIVFDIPALIAILIPIGTYWGIAFYLIKRNA